MTDTITDEIAGSMAGSMAYSMDYAEPGSIPRTMPAGRSFRFGVELELILGSKGSRPFKNWDELAKDVSKRLDKAGIKNHVHSRSRDETFEEWFLIREITIDADVVGQQYGMEMHGMELVSPVYPAEGGLWAADLGVIFATLHANYTVATSDKCSTHVHLSTSEPTLDADNATKLAEAILFYEEAIDALMPGSRTADSNYWGTSNRESHMFSCGGLAGEEWDTDEAIQGYVKAMAKAKAADKSVKPVGVNEFWPSTSLDTCLSIVRACHDSSKFDMDEAMNLHWAGTRYGRVHGMKADFVHGKTFKWNFGKLYRVSSAGIKKISGRGTVEFRQPPGSLVAQDAVTWVALAVTFFAGVVSGNGDLPFPARTGASVADLECLVDDGSAILGLGYLGNLKELLRQARSKAA